MRNFLKQLKLNESTISMILGALVIVVVGLLVINYFKGLEPGSQLPDGIATEGNDSLPTSHVVQAGETLWDISETYYESGYNWIDIQEANDLSNPNAITEGQSLVIPDVASREPDTDVAVVIDEEGQVEETESPEPTAMVAVAPTATPSATETPMATQTPTPTEEPEGMQQEIQGEEYTVVHGDTLWDIAVRAYGDGYRWVDIARANDLDNPDVIHTGNVFTLPR